MRDVSLMCSPIFSAAVRALALSCLWVKIAEKRFAGITKIAKTALNLKMQFEISTFVRILAAHFTLTIKCPTSPFDLHLIGSIIKACYRFFDSNHKNNEINENPKTKNELVSFGLPVWRVYGFSFFFFFWFKLDGLLPSLSRSMSSKGHPHHLPKMKPLPKNVFFLLTITSWRFRLIVIYVFMNWNFLCSCWV